jgi:hypothetical protein
MNYINTIILSQTLKQFEKIIVRKMSGFRSCLYENEIVSFVLKGAENLPACRRKTEKTLLWSYILIGINCHPIGVFLRKIGIFGNFFGV